jgi:acetolactate synthase I/III small subunit
VTVPGIDLRHHILSVTVVNQAGVLARISGLFARRGFNIFSLAVAPTDDDRFSRVTIVVDVESTPLEQITKQLFKLVDVLKISELDPAEAVERELLLVTVKATPETRSQVTEVVAIFEGTIVDVGHDALTASLSGRPSKLDDVTELLRPFGILELQRTGRVALPKRDRTPRTATIRKAS